ncbi:MAG: InlB B-repeat-containing protein [Oscillospiraceae bacterium]|nr:InlB B-repeat-containing protein [Oscillospiraceae bacterium]
MNGKNESSSSKVVLSPTIDRDMILSQLNTFAFAVISETESEAPTETDDAECAKVEVNSMIEMKFDGNEQLSDHGTYGKKYWFLGKSEQKVQIRMDSTDFDSFLLLYDSEFNLVAYDDDAGRSLNARIDYVLPSDGYYYIVATQWSSSLGSATLFVGYPDSTITYDANDGGLGGPWLDMFVSEHPIQIVDSIPTILHGSYMFCGWTTQKVSVEDSANYLEKIYQPGEFTNLAGSTTLYALWACCDSPLQLPFSVEANLSDSMYWSPSTWERGFCYCISLDSSQTLVATMDSNNIDSLLILYNKMGEIVAYDDDSGYGSNAPLIYCAPEQCKFYLHATSWNTPSPDNGMFTLSVEVGSSSKIVTLEYDANGGTNSPENLTTLANAAVTISSVIPTLKENIFMGWSTSNTATIVDYMPGDTFIFGNINLMFYALWEKYKLVEELPFSSYEELNYTDDGRSQRGTLMKGYSFYAYAGSAIIATMSSSVVDPCLYLLNSNGDLVAHNDDSCDDSGKWTCDSRIVYMVEEQGMYYLQATTYSVGTGYFNLSIELGTKRMITYDAQGGYPTPPPAYLSGEKAQISNLLPIRLGYTFMGWDTVPEGKGHYQRDKEYTFENDITLYAIWSGHDLQVNEISAPSYTKGELLHSPLLETDRDRHYDVYSVELTFGQDVTILMESSDFDCFLYLLNPDGSFYTLNDDYCGNLDAMIKFTAPIAGKYYILASQYSGNRNGRYSLTVISYGDVDGDGEVTLGDATRIAQYVNKWPVDINTKSADVDDDGEVTLADAILIAKYVNKWFDKFPIERNVIQASNIVPFSIAASSSQLLYDNLTVSVIGPSGSVKQGETVVVEVKIEGNSGLASLALDISYDANVFELVSKSNASRGAALGSLLFTGLNDMTYQKNPFRVSWFGTKQDDSNGVILLIDFKIKDDAADGDYCITVDYSPRNTRDEDLKLVALDTVNASVTVAATAVKAIITEGYKIYDSNFKPAPVNMVLNGGSAVQFYATLDGLVIESDIKWVVSDTRLAAVNYNGLVNANINKYTGQLTLLLYSSGNKLLDSIILRII